jgi:hypothetical protein
MLESSLEPGSGLAQVAIGRSHGERATRVAAAQTQPAFGNPVV